MVQAPCIEEMKFWKHKDSSTAQIQTNLEGMTRPLVDDARATYSDTEEP